MNIMRNLRKERVGIVTSSKMNKSITVEVERRVKHPKYGKFVKKSSSFVAHDEKNECAMNELVSIQESRPLSKKKRWVVINRLS